MKFSNRRVLNKITVLLNLMDFQSQFKFSIKIALKILPIYEIPIEFIHENTMEKSLSSVILSELPVR